MGVGEFGYSGVEQPATQRAGRQGGNPLAGLGVTQDEEVRLTRRQLLEGQDSALKAAIHWIQRTAQAATPGK